MMLDHPRALATSVAFLLICVVSCSTPDSGNAPEESTKTAEPPTGPAAVAPGQQPQGQDTIIAAQRNKLLVQEYLERAERLRRQGDQASLRAAQLELLKAREKQPNNEEVQRLLTAIAAELKEPQAAGESFAEHQLRLHQINEQRRRAEVVALLDSATAALAENNYKRAIEDLRRVVLSIEVGTQVDWGELEQRATDMLARAEQEQEAAQREQYQAAQREITEERRRVDGLVAARRQARVDDFLGKGARAFEARKFKLAQDLAYEAMQLDQNNQTARNMHNASIKASRESRTDRYYRDMSRAIRKMQEASEDLRIPQTDILYTDPEVWSRANQRAEAEAAVYAVDPDDAALRQRLRDTPLSGLVFTAESGAYSDVKTQIQTITAIPIIITPPAREAIDSEGLALVMDISAPISVDNLLNQMVAKSDTLAWTVHNGVVEITTKALAGGENFLAQKDVRDLVAPKTVFLPPTIRDIPSGEDFGDTPRTGGEDEEKTYFVEMDTLILTIKDATDPTYWDAEGGGQIDQAESGYLLVTANHKMQERVDGVLGDLRRFSTSVVTIESKFLSISQAFLQQIGVDFRGLGGSGEKGTVALLDDVTNGLDDNASRGLDNSGTGDPAASPVSGAFFNDGGDGDVRARTENFFANSLNTVLTPNGGATMALTFLDDLQVQMIIRAVEKREDVQELNGQNLTVLNSERGHVAVINQTAYVRDFDVEVAQAAFIADPKIDVIQDGVVLDVKPTISHNRKKITLEMQPTVAELMRPIATFSTSLAGTTQPVTLQLPQLMVRSFATTVTVPDGGSVLIGGLRTVVNSERKATVPILGDIPILSFFFEQQTTVDENSSLMVLVRASVTDVRTLMERQ